METTTLKLVYRKLVLTFHPDKALTDVERQHFTHMIKKINEFYKQGELRKLLYIHKYKELLKNPF